MTVFPTRLALAFSLVATGAFAQADEINPAKLIQGKLKATLTPQEVVDLGQDPTAFGVALREIRVRDTRIKQSWKRMPLGGCLGELEVDDWNYLT